MQILIIDDDDFNLFTLKSMVEDLGLNCEVFLSGAEAVKCFQKRL
jgi:CheY-like chemotaxis protein